MKTLILFMTLAASAAHALTLTPVQTPTLPKSQAHACDALTFNADDTAQGFCRAVTWGGCSGRGCQPTYTYQFFDTRWNTDGSVVSSVPCGTWVTHLPALSQWTYQPKYDATTCHNFNLNAGEQEYIPVDAYHYWFYYLTASVNGAYALYNGYGTGWIGTY